MKRAILTGAALGLALGALAAAYTKGRAAYTETCFLADQLELDALQARIAAAIGGEDL